MSNLVRYPQPPVDTGPGVGPAQIITPPVAAAPNADPIGKAGCQLWLKDVSAADGSAVTSWADESGTGNTVANGSGTVSHETSEINGLPVKRWDGGANDYLVKDPAGGFNVPYTVAIVWRMNATAGPGVFRTLLNLGDLTQPASAVITISDQEQVEVYGGTGLAMGSNTTLSAGTVSVNVVTCAAGSVQPTIYKAGNVDDSSGVGAAQTYDFTPAGVQVGAFRTGIQEILTDADIGEVVFYDSVVDVDRTRRPVRLP